MKKLWLCILTLLILPLSTKAAGEFVPLVGIPGLNTAEDFTLQNYINALYILAISIAAFLAVVRLIYAGVQYILSDVITSKENAKKDIRNSILGLFIVLGAVLLLETINPQLTNLNALGELKPSRTALQAIVVPEKTSFPVAFGPEILGSTLNWDSASTQEKSDFEMNCPGAVVVSTKSSGERVGTCTLSSDTIVDPDLVASSKFNSPNDNMLATFELRSNQVSSQIGTTVYPNDVKGLLVISDVPGDDEAAFSITLQPACEEKGGSHIAYTFYAAKYEFWCVGNSSN